MHLPALPAVSCVKLTVDVRDGPDCVRLGERRSISDPTLARRSMNKKLLVCSALLLLSSCASYDTPYSLLGATKTNLSANTFNIGIERVDGASPMQEPIKLTPAFTRSKSAPVASATPLPPCRWTSSPAPSTGSSASASTPAGNVIKVKVDRTEAIPGCKIPEKK